METIMAMLVALISLFGMADDPSTSQGDTCSKPFVREWIVCEDDYPCGQILAKLDEVNDDGKPVCWIDSRAPYDR